MKIKESELILRPDGSIYHLKLKPGDIAQTIITVGDPERIDMVTSHFDELRFEVQTREFRTVTGSYKGKEISVISTGIGTDNIDIVFNELDALFNVDFETRTIKDKHTSLDLIRIGTSGAIQKDIPVDSKLISVAAIGMDGLMEYYKYETPEILASLQNSFTNQSTYCCLANEELLRHFDNHEYFKGITITAKGFYAPQNRSIRLQPRKDNFFEEFESLEWNNYFVTNLEMETAGIYAMAHLLGHRAISFNAILANRKTGTFSAKAEETTNALIKSVLNGIHRL